MIRNRFALAALFLGLLAAQAHADKIGPPPIPLDCNTVREADVREECLKEIPNGTPTGVWRTQRSFANQWTFRREVLSTGGEAAHVQFSWETVALDFGPSDFRRPALFFSCVIGQDGRAGMSLSYMHDKIRLEMPPVAGMSWRRGKLRIELDGAQEIIDFPRWTVVWMMHNSDQIRRTLDRWTGHKRVKIFHDVALEDHPNKNGYAVFDLEPLTEIRSLLTEKCRW